MDIPLIQIEAKYLRSNSFYIIIRYDNRVYMPSGNLDAYTSSNRSTYLEHPIIVLQYLLPECYKAVNVTLRITPLLAPDTI